MRGMRNLCRCIRRSGRETFQENTELNDDGTRRGAIARPAPKHIVNLSVPEQEQAGLAERVHELFGNNEKDWNVGTTIQLAPINKGRGYIVRLLSIQAAESDPRVIDYTWDVSGIAKVANLDEFKKNG